MKKLNALFFGLFLAALLNGQTGAVRNSYILFSGVVFDAARFEPLPNTQILINRSYETSSDSTGGFSLEVVSNDSITFTRLGYKDLVYIVSDSLGRQEFIAGVYLQADTLLISEVVIMPRLSTLKSDILKPRTELSQDQQNAKYNLALSAYQGKITSNRLGDPALNYELLRQRQRYDAYTKGQIPGDKMVALSPLMLIPAAYLLIHGLPEKPKPVLPSLTEQEKNSLHRRYIENQKLNK